MADSNSAEFSQLGQLPVNVDNYKPNKTKQICL